MNIWNNCEQKELTSLLSFIVDNRGKTVPVIDDSNGIKLIATNCIKNESLYPIYEKVRYLSEDTYKNWFRAHPVPGDIIFVNKGTPGKVAFVPNPVDFCIAQDMMAFRCKSEIIYNKYLFAVLRNPKIQEQIRITSVGDVIPHFKKEFLSEIKIPVPDMKIQKYLGDMYFMYSEKIELNNKINANLEQQAQALFKSWFSERIEKVSETNGKPLGTLIDIVDNRGKTPPSSPEKNEFPILDVGALNSIGRIIDYKNCTKYVDENTYNTFFRDGHPQENDILLSTVGSLAQMKLFKGSIGCIAQNVVAFRTCELSPFYLYEYLKFIKNDLLAYDIGSVQPSIKVTHIIKHLIYIPTEVELNKFDSIAKSITEQIYNNVCENEKLTSIRDTLLPKLMNGGEIEV